MLITIDPGKSGAIAFKDEDGHIHVHSFKDEYSAVEFMRGCEDSMCYLEQVSAMPGQGVTSCFSFGENFGFYRGVLQAFAIPFETVRPQKWQKSLGIPESLRGKSNQSARKRWLKQKASELFPDIKVTLANADALLMLYVYGQNT